MQMEVHISTNYEANVYPENIITSECSCGGTPSSLKLDQKQPEVPSGAKKSTRRWAAWTRQEEEMFFNALRQYGKNFEKITSRVPSKNKDQVRHYYYRLLRRMNKLLGPEVCLDAGNSKDTNAAMLRWWTLLEKYSCKSSKLHLKPRRFKIFLETLESQLMKDRKKQKRKQPSQRENYSPTTPTVISQQGRTLMHDGPTVRVLVDSQNIQSNSSKEVPLKRNSNVGVGRKNCKPEILPTSTGRQRKKPATTSKAAHKRWEKAAIAGVSLVADAAEHLERTTIDKEVDQDQGQTVSDFNGSDVPSCSPFPPYSFADNNAQTSGKRKLQLFPIDEGTRKALEIDTHNPYLELTLIFRKKISSVLEHLNRKWGKSSVASGELMLFPCYAQGDNLAGYLRWTQDSVLSVAEVFALVGSPSVFRLRYGWCSKAELASATFQAPIVSSGMLSNLHINVNVEKEHSTNQMKAPMPSSVCQSSHPIDCYDRDQQALGENAMDTAPSLVEVPNELGAGSGVEATNSLPQSSVFRDRRETSNGPTLREEYCKDDLQVRSGHLMSAGDWADSLTSISVGDLLSEVSHNIANCIDPLPMGSSQSQQIPFSCDSFDAAIAAHIYRHQNRTSLPPASSSFGPSIWEAEETCDAFSFQKSAPSAEAFNRIGGASLAGYSANIKESLEIEVPTGEEPVLEEPMFEFTMNQETEDDKSGNENPMDQHQVDPIVENSPRTINDLTDTFWPESLGQLDLDTPASKYHNEDLILSDSLSGFSRLFGNSLDAFQNCTLFGFDKKETVSGVEAQETTSFSDYKVGSGITDLDAFQNCSLFGFDKKETVSGVEAQETTSFSDYKVGSGITDFAKA